MLSAENLAKMMFMPDLVNSISETKDLRKTTVSSSTVTCLLSDNDAFIPVSVKAIHNKTAPVNFITYLGNIIY